MPRFLIPAAILLAALLVLVAGTVGDLPSWYRSVSSSGGPAVSASAVVPAAVPAPTEATSRDGETRRRLEELQAQIGKQQQEMESLRMAAEQARRELASLRSQPQPGLTTLSSGQTAADQDLAASSPAGYRGVAASPAIPEGNPAPAPAPREVAAVPTSTAEPVAKAVAPAAVRTASIPVANGATSSASVGLQRSSNYQAGYTLSPPILRHLIQAQAALSVGRTPAARWQLRVARDQMVSARTATRPDAEQVKMLASLMGAAIDQLNRRDAEGASRTIDKILAANEAQPGAAQSPDAAGSGGAAELPAAGVRDHPGLRDAARQNYRVPPDKS